MANVPIEVIVYNTYPNQVFGLNLPGDTTLGTVRNAINSLIAGGDAQIERAWVSFADERISFIPFSKPELGSDNQQIMFLRSSMYVLDSLVYIGALKQSVHVNSQHVPDVALQSGPSNKRPFDDSDEQFTRSTFSRVV